MGCFFHIEVDIIIRRGPFMVVSDDFSSGGFSNLKCPKK